MKSRVPQVIQDNVVLVVANTYIHKLPFLPELTSRLQHSLAVIYLSSNIGLSNNVLCRHLVQGECWRFVFRVSLSALILKLYGVLWVMKCWGLNTPFEWACFMYSHFVFWTNSWYLCPRSANVQLVLRFILCSFLAEALTVHSLDR